MPHKALPLYVFIPGKNLHPKKAGGHMEGEQDPVVSTVDPERPSASETLRYSLDLLNHGFFWESHVYFEALWNAHKRVGVTAEFLKAMIKLGAAGVKFNIGQKESALGHLARARELLLRIQEEVGPLYLGFSLPAIIEQIDANITGDSLLVEIHPDWE